MAERDNNIIKYMPLYWALVEGDLGTVKKLLDIDPNAIYAQISTIRETPIHVAVSHGHEEVARELHLRRLKMDRTMASCDEKRSPTVKDEYGDTVLHIAARGASQTIIANALLHHSPSLLGMRDADEQLPLTLAAIFGNWNMLDIFKKHDLDIAIHPNSDGHDTKWNIFKEFIKSKNFGLARRIWREESEPMNFKDALFIMAEMVSVFPTANQHTDFERWMYNSKCMLVLYSSLKRNMDAVDAHPQILYNSKIFVKVRRFLKGLTLSVLKVLGIEEILHVRTKNIQARELLSKMCSPIWTFDSKHVGVYFEAIKRAIKYGNVEFVEEVLRSNPALLWGFKDKKNGTIFTIFHIAVALRQEKIWNLIYGLPIEHINKITGILVESNSLLHVAACPTVMFETIGFQGEGSKKMKGGKKPRKVFSKARDAAMKVQRELQWYKEVERMVPSSYILRANKNEETPSDLFSNYHYELIKEGEQWMREVAGSFTIVAALIVTVMFAAAFTLPGGTDDHSGNPKFLQRNSFLVFIISDAISLFSSVTAVLMFLNILTSRCTKEDFLKSQPKRLIIGLATLFLSIATMMVTFVATLVIVLGERVRMAVAPITLLAGVPVTSFVLLQFPLFVDMVSSTYGHGIFNRKTKCSFFNNPNKYVPQER